MVSRAVWKTWPSGLSNDKNLGLRPRFLSTESLGPCFSHSMGDHDQILHSKPESPYQPACVRSVTSGLRSVRLCKASASWCWINGWNVRQKLNLCLLWRHDHTKVTWSPWLPFMISFFLWPWRRSSILKTSQTMKIAARATAARARNSKHQSDHRGTKPAAGSQISVTL